MSRFPGVGLIVTLAALSLLALGAPDPAGAGGPATGPRQFLMRGWHAFLTLAAVRRPTGIAVDLRGNPRTGQWAYVADAASGRILKFGTGGRVLGSWQWGPAGRAAALAVGGSGNLFVADEAGGRIRKFSPAGKLLGAWGPFAGVRGITLDARGHIYVAEYDAHRITELSPGGAVLRWWDTQAGLPSLFSVPHVNSGPLGDPTGVALDPPSHLFVTTFCRADPSCRPHWDTPTQPYAHDALAVVQIVGAYTGYVGNFWFGLAYSPTGAPVDVPAKEAEPIVTVDAMTSDRSGHAYLAGTFWPLGGALARGVLSYTDLGSRTGPWPLPSISPVSGIAVDGNGSVYVSQGNRVLQLFR